MKEYTREQIEAMYGHDVVTKLDAENCEPTSRVYDHEDHEIEWAASVTVETADGHDEIVALYYTDADDAAIAEERGDWDMVDWQIDRYQINKY